MRALAIHLCLLVYAVLLLAGIFSFRYESLGLPVAIPCFVVAVGCVVMGIRMAAKNKQMDLDTSFDELC